MTLTILEVCDRLQEILMDNDMEDLPVYLVDSDGAIVVSREEFFLVETVNDSGGEFDAVVVRQ